MAAEHATRVRNLYKFILRLHRNLPDELRVLGDNYTKEEFKRHKKCQPGEARIFLIEWREYALSMSRQVAPVRAQPRALDDDQVVPATVEDPEVPSSDEDQVVPDILKEVNQKGSGAAGSPEDPMPSFGFDLTPSRILQMTPEQISSLLTLKDSARNENAHGLIEAEIESVDTNVFVKQIQDAKKYITDVENEEMAKLIRGEIKFEDLTFQTTWWLQMFDDVVNLKQKQQAEKDKKAKDEEKIDPRK